MSSKNMIEMAATNPVIDQTVGESKDGLSSTAEEKSCSCVEELEGEDEELSGSGFSYACSQCNATFGTELFRHQHKEKHLRGSICSLCGYEPSSSEDARGSRVGGVTTRCRWCSYISQRVSDIKNHADDHRRRFSLYCSICRYYAFSEEDLKKHSLEHKVERGREMRWRVVGGPAEPTIESRCIGDDEAGSKDGCKIKLDALMDRAMFRCCLCRLRLKTEQQMEEHMAEHMKPACSYCPYCTFSTEDNEQIFQHVLNHLQPTSSSHASLPTD